LTDGTSTCYKKSDNRQEKRYTTQRGSILRASKKLLDMLNRGVAREVQVSVQYMWQHVRLSGAKHSAVEDKIKSIAVSEMKHAEAIAERLTSLGGVPTTKPEPIFVGKTLKAMLARDAKDEEGAIKLYKEIIALADKEGDIPTRKLFKGILRDEVRHRDAFVGLLKRI
jgi:bacterioferritin